jgi:hypothetical protein
MSYWVCFVPFELLKVWRFWSLVVLADIVFFLVRIMSEGLVMTVLPGLPRSVESPFFWPPE